MLPMRYNLLSVCQETCNVLEHAEQSLLTSFVVVI